MGCCGGKEEGMLDHRLEDRRIMAMKGVMMETDAGSHQSINPATIEKPT